MAEREDILPGVELSLGEMNEFIQARGGTGWKLRVERIEKFIGSHLEFVIFKPKSGVKNIAGNEEQILIRATTQNEIYCFLQGAVEALTEIKAGEKNGK